MPWIDFWHRMACPSEPKLDATSGGDVHDELMFHFRALVNEKLAAGAAFDVAWKQAEQQFGPLRRYENECHAMQLERRLTWRMAGALAVLLVVACGGWSLFENRGLRLSEELRLLQQEVQSVQREQSQRAIQSGLIANDQRPATGIDLTGVVLREGNQPLPGATVLIILKTWPSGEYQQKSFTATTGADGRFNLPGLVPADRRYAIQVAAVKDGFAFQSVYQLQQTKPFEQVDPIRLRLEPASLITLVVRDEKGKPVPNALVIPSARKSRRGENHLIYFQGSEPVQSTTDSEGRVRLKCFSTGDLAEIYLQRPGSDWDSREFEVPGTGSVIEVASSGGDAM